jgi:hypothetical protein
MLLESTISFDEIVKKLCTKEMVDKLEFVQSLIEEEEGKNEN